MFKEAYRFGPLRRIRVTNFQTYTVTRLHDGFLLTYSWHPHAGLGKKHSGNSAEALPDIPEAERTANLLHLWRNLPVGIVAQTVGITSAVHTFGPAIEKNQTIGRLAPACAASQGTKRLVAVYPDVGFDVCGLAVLKRRWKKVSALQTTQRSASCSLQTK